MGLSASFPKLFSYIPNQYARAAIVLVVLFLVFRLLLALFKKFFMRVTAKTKTDIDDKLVKKSALPLNLVALVLSLRVALEEIALSPALALNIERIVYSVLVISFAYMVYVFVDIALIAAWSRVAKKSNVPINESLNNLVQGTLTIILIALAILYILDLWGIAIVPVLGALGVAGLAVALALQPVLANIFSGVSLIMDKSINVGDWVIIDDKTSGTIEKIGIRSTRVKTSDNDMIIVPNTKLADSYIRNASLPEPKVRKVVQFSVAYGSDVEKVKKIVSAELGKISWVVNDPEPFVRFVEMGPSSLDFKAFFHIDSFENGNASIDEANTRIYNALRKAGIGIPFPQLDVHLKKE